MYWILSNELVDEDNDADLSGGVNVELGGDLSFDNGTFMKIPVPKIILTLNNDSRIGNMTDHLSISELYGLVFSKKLRDVLGELGVDNIQYFDLDIVDPKTGKHYTDYKIANVVGLVDCVDIDKSDLTYFDDGDIEFIDKLVLNETKIPSNIKVFCLLNDASLPLVHQSIKNAIDGSDITGCVFYKPEDYH